MSLALSGAPTPWASSRSRVRTTRASRGRRGQPRRLSPLLPRRRPPRSLTLRGRPDPLQAAPLSRTRPFEWTGAGSSSSTRPPPRPTGRAGSASSPLPGGGPPPGASPVSESSHTCHPERRGLSRRLPLLLPRRRQDLLVESQLHALPWEGEARLVPCRWCCLPRLLLARSPPGSPCAVTLSRTRPFAWTGAGSSSSARPSHPRPMGGAGEALPPVPAAAWPGAASKGLVRAARASRGRRGLRLPLQLSPRRRVLLLLVELALRTPLRKGGGKFASCRSRSSPRLLLLGPSWSSRAVPLSHTRPSRWTGAGSSSSVGSGRW